MRGHPGAVERIVFLLCSVGLVSTWTVLYAVFFRQGMWLLPSVAGFYFTLLEAGWIFGIIYGMDPALFPPAFCRWQAITISCGAYGISSVFALLSHTVYMNLRVAATSARPPNPLHVATRLVPVAILFPAACTAVFATVATRMDAFGQSWLICDAIDPPWTRLLSYAGLDWIVIAPALVTASLTILRLLRLRRSFFSGGHFPVPNGAIATSSSIPSSPAPTQTSFLPPTVTPVSPPPEYVTPTREGFGAAERPPPSPGKRERHLSGMTLRTADEDDTDAKSVSPSMLSAPTVPLQPMRRPQGITQRILEYEGLDRIVWGGREIRPAASVLAEREEARAREEEERDAAQGEHALLPTPLPLLPSPVPVRLGLASAGVEAKAGAAAVPFRELELGGVPLEEEAARRRRDARHAFDAILRVVVLVLVAMITQGLASISPLVSVGRNSVDHGFGTQHLAGFAAAAFAAPLCVAGTPAFASWVAGTWHGLRQRCTRRPSR